jgi:hypothetical protein
VKLSITEIVVAWFVFKLALAVFPESAWGGLILTNSGQRLFSPRFFSSFA